MQATMKAYDPKVTPWSLREEDFPRGGDLAAPSKFLLGYAILAPSSHNTQPWKFGLWEEGAIDVLLDYDGWLRVADYDQRELHLSVGCALENLLIAARHFGCTPEVTYFPEPGNVARVARVVLKTAQAMPSDAGSLFAAMTFRRTHHKPFEARPIEPEALRRIKECCDVDGMQLYLTGDEEIRRQVDDLIARSDAATFANPAWREELAHWIGKGVFGTPWLIAQLGRLATAYLNLGKPTQRSDREVLMSAPVLALLATTNNDRVSQLKAGQIFERIYLTCALAGIGVRPMSQICQIPEHREELRQLIPLPGGFPLQPFLLGYAESAEDHTPRKSVEEVLSHETEE